MTDEELQGEIQKVSEDLDKLFNSEQPLTKEEKKRKKMLSLKKRILTQIRDARQRNDKVQEFNSTIDYALLTTLGEKQPFLMHFLRSKFGWHVF
jgi:ElaB/YqjD/DUF883 family membrane-anchored ribosome-binding protein